MCAILTHGYDFVQKWCEIAKSRCVKMMCMVMHAVPDIFVHAPILLMHMLIKVTVSTYLHAMPRNSSYITSVHEPQTKCSALEVQGSLDYIVCLA